MSNYLHSVSEFHETFGHPVLDEPQVPAAKRASLRVALLQEELDELQEAIENKDIVAAADAFADLQYVLAGAILEFGLKEKFDQLFTEVHRSNMSKACNSEKEAQETVAHYLQNHATASYYVEKEGKWLVYRKEDNKTLKNIYYSEAQLHQIVNQ